MNTTMILTKTQNGVTFDLFFNTDNGQYFWRSSEGKYNLLGIDKRAALQQFESCLSR